MKLLPSYSISSSSSASPSFDPNMCISKSTRASFLSGILRRILCSRTLPTYPSDLMTKTISVVGENKKRFGKVDPASNSPGIVARLMGLESMPQTASSDHLMKCRSVDSAEMLTFVEEENEEFFVLSFDDGGDYKRGEKKLRKKENGVEEIKEEDEEKIKKMVSRILDEGSVSSRISDEGLIHDSHWKDLNLDSLHKLDYIHCNESRIKRKKKKKKLDDQEPQCSSEESSPVSVLDFNQFLIDPSDQKESNPRNDCSEEFLGTDFMLQDQNSNRRTDECHISERKSCKSFDGSTLWSEIWKLSDRETIFSNWVPRNSSKLQDFDDIGEDLGQKIMDQLLEELVGLQLLD